MTRSAAGVCESGTAYRSTYAGVVQAAWRRQSLLLWLRRFRVAYRFQLVVAVQAALIVAASYAAFWLRFDGSVPAAADSAHLQVLPWLFVIRGAVFVPFGLYRDTWRYSSVWDLCRIVLAVGTSSTITYVVVHFALQVPFYPRSILLIDSLLLVSLLGGARLAWRLAAGSTRWSRGRRVLIVGAGDAGEMIVREMRRSPAYHPIGFLDDAEAKTGRTIHGVRVLGTRRDVARVVAATRPAEVLIAIPSADAATVRGLVREFERYKLPITTLPGLSELVNGTVGIKHIRPLAIEDLLPRTRIDLNGDDVRQMVQGRRVLVTGAGGSIGSELCRQIAALEPERLLLLERYENSLYAIGNDLADRGLHHAALPIIGDITDAALVDAVFAEHRPQIVFHAAAHKHVPLMEANPCEAVKNNVAGTQTVADAAHRHGAERFVLISTDKAANPSSVMGATKRVAELLVEQMSGAGSTRFVTVRFGNVLGSNGSVIPRMLDQIRSGGPVTVTHPEMRRYFMLIPEAVQLVLRAAVLAQGRGTFVLDMGEQLRVLDVARNLIRLCGFVPDEDIPITFIGLRPGEKLEEQLAGDGEALEPAGMDKIFRVKRHAFEADPGLEARIAALVWVAGQGGARAVVEHLREVVPTFTPRAAASVSPAADSDAAEAPSLSGWAGAVNPLRARSASPA